MSITAERLSVACFVGLAFGAYMAVADATVFHSVIPISQTELVVRWSTVQRIEFFAVLAVTEEIVFRWTAVSLLIRLMGSPWVAIIFVALVINPAAHASYIASLDPSVLTVVREVMLHGAAGILWGYLYWQQGLASAIAGHVCAHLSLEPLLSALCP